MKKPNFSDDTKLDALNNAEDKIILDAIDAKTAVTTDGDDEKSIADDANFDSLVADIAYGKALALGNGEHGFDVAVAISRMDWALLHKAMKFTNSDYASISDGKYSLVGGLLIPCESVAQGTTYVIPAKTICFASFAGGDKASISELVGKDEYVVTVRKSYGAGIFTTEAPNIVKFSTKVIV